ncbi:MAG TPA: hypothetical protein VK358_11880 [Longimicrobium sp.]|nr:hypothetical protein [Longimicrobium sp.]
MYNGSNGSAAISLRLAEFRARDDFYKALFEQAELAKRGEALLPVVPPVDELTYVDGFLVWKGRPVWWSGGSGSTAVTASLDGPGLIDPPFLSQPAPEPQPRRAGPRLRRWFHLRWRWA